MSETRMDCPYCHADMDYFDHGTCRKKDCQKRCGCSFCPVSDSDFCKYHLEQLRTKK